MLLQMEGVSKVVAPDVIDADPAYVNFECRWVKAC